MLHCLGCCLRAGHTGGSRDCSGVGVQPFQIQSEGPLGTVLLRIWSSSRCADQDLFEIGGFAAPESADQTLNGCLVRHAKRVMQQRFAIAATEIGESLRIAIVRLYAGINMLSMRDGHSILEAGALPGVGVIGDNRRFGSRLFPSDEGLERNR